MTYVRRCKYECGTQLLGFDEIERKYKEHPSGILHTKERCTEAKKKLQNQPQQQNKVVDQDQRTKDIKDAQKERREQHRELIVTMKNLTKTIIHLEAHMSGRIPQDIEDTLGFEQYREEQRSFEDDVV